MLFAKQAALAEQLRGLGATLVEASALLKWPEPHEYLPESELPSKLDAMSSPQKGRAALPATSRKGKTLEGDMPAEGKTAAKPVTRRRTPHSNLSVAKPYPGEKPSVIAARLAAHAQTNPTGSIPRLLNAKDLGVRPIVHAWMLPKPPVVVEDRIDPETGIRQSLLNVLRGVESEGKGKKKTAPSKPPRNVLYRTDPIDMQFHTPVIIAEPASRKRERRSIMLKVITEIDMGKLDGFYITWDCHTCLRTYPTRELLMLHRPECREGAAELTAGPKGVACHYCSREFSSEPALASHKEHTHGDLKEVKLEITTEHLQSEVTKIQKWVDECDIDCQKVENCMNTLYQLNDTLIMMMVYLASRDNATRQLAGREMMVMVDIAVKASALGCSTSAVSVADITSANPTVVAGLFHAIAHLEGYGLLPSSLRQQVDDTRRKRNIVFHTLGVVLDEEGLEKQCSLAVNVVKWSQLLMDRTLNVVQARDPLLPPVLPKVEPIVIKIDPDAPRLPNGALASGPAPYIPPGVQSMGNQSGIPAWKYTAPAVPILNVADVLLGSAPQRQLAAKPGML